MRTAHLLRKYNPEEWGGTETAIHRLCIGLRQHAIDSTIYCPAINPATDHAPDPLSAAGFELRRFRTCVPIWGISQRQKQQLIALGGNLMSFDLITALRNEPHLNLIHTHTLGRLGGIARTVANWRGIPCVVSIHGGVLDLPPALKHQEPIGGWEWGKLFGALVRARHILKEADALITCNQKEAHLLQQVLPTQRIHVQSHGVPVELYQTDHRKAAQAAFPQISNRPLLLAVGRIDSIKNQGWLVDQMPTILQKHPKILLALAGACTEIHYHQRLQQRLRDLGVHDQVLLTGGLPPADPRLIGLFQNAQAVLLPSLSETFGLVILEAWAAGTPVLSSRTTGASAVIRHGENGWLFDLKNPQSFHDALGFVLTNPPRARQLTQQGYHLVRTEFNSTVLAGRLKRLYESLIETKHALRNRSR